MTIYKTKKVNDFSALDYYYANEAFDYYAEKELAKLMVGNLTSL